MSKVKSNLIKLFSCLFAVCIGVAIFAMPTSNEVGANDTAVFEMAQGASIRLADTTNEDTGDNYTGLRFQTNVNEKWFEENSAERYVFGTLIFPTANIEAFDTSKSPSQNASDDYELQAENILANLDLIRENHCYTAGIVFDEDVIKAEVKKRYEANGKEFNDTVWAEIKPELMYNVSKADFTAVSYVLKDGNVTYLTPYSTSMHKVAVRTIVALDNGTVTDDADNTLRNSAKNYVGELTYETGYVSMEDNLLVMDSVEGYSANDSTYVSFDNTTIDTELDANSQIQVTANYSSSVGSYKTAYVFDMGSVKVVKTFFADKMLKSASDVISAFDRDTWAEDDARIEGTHDTVYALCGDVDMSGTMITNNTSKDFKGVFDGRGYSIKNATVEQSVNYSRGFFNNTRSASIRNVAFRNFNANGDTANASAFSFQVDLSTYENIFVEYGENTARRGLFKQVKSETTFKNVVVSMLTSNYTSWTTTFGTSPFISFINDVHKDVVFDNVYVISPKALGYYRTGSTSVVGGALNAEPVYDEEAGVYTYVGETYSYAENETDLHYTYQAFRDILGEGVTPNVENTKDITFTYISSSKQVTTTKTKVIDGVRRYNDYNALASDTSEKHISNVEEMLSTGLWKVVDGQVLWYNDKATVSVTGGDYDASANVLTSTALNNVKVNKVLLNGVELERGTEYFVDEDGYFTGIYGKTSDSDLNNGIAYITNNTNTVIQDEIVIETDDYAYTLSGINYWTKIIYNAADLKEALDNNVDYSVVATTEPTRVSGNGIKYNVHTDGNEYAFNIGVYKLGENIDMYDTEKEEYVQLDYTGLTPARASITGGFSGTFDGDGHVIDNFKPTSKGMFGTFATSGSGLVSANGDQGARIKNVAFTNVLTSEVKSSTTYPILISTMYTSEGWQQRVNDVYVSYSENATDMYGLVTTPTTKLYLNNVYVVNEQGYHAIDSEKVNQYYFENGTKLDSSKYYRDVFGGNGVKASSSFYSSSLFGSVRYLTDISTTYINDVIVASPNTISFYFEGTQYAYTYLYKIDFINRKVFFSDSTLTEKSNWFKIGRYYYGNSTVSYLCSGCGNYYASQSCSLGCEGATFTTRKANANNRYKHFGYAGNETTGNVPFMEDIAPMLLAEMESPAIVDGVILNHLAKAGTTGIHAYACNVCGSYASFIKDSKCYNSECEGTNTIFTESTKYEAETTNTGIWSSGLAYEWIFPDLQSYSETAKFSNSNSIVRLMGVTRYDTVAEVTANCDFSSFTSKVWTIGADGSLNWTSLYTAQA